MMTKEDYIAIALKKYNEIEDLVKIDNFYDYEKKFIEIWKDLGREVLEKNISDAPKDRRKKKTLTKFGKIDISNTHKFSSGNYGFQISPALQELMVYVGQLECYEKSSELIKKFIELDVSETQIYRVTDFYGEKIEESVIQNNNKKPIEKGCVLYAEIDGSMLFTREEKWKEVKVGRIFRSEDCLNPNSKSQYITQSEYQAHLGNCKEFTLKMEDSLDYYGNLNERLVFINDGAVWIRNWISATYPKAVSILDLYHALEYLHNFSNQHFKDKEQEQEWLKNQKELLLESQVKKVIENITNLGAKANQTKKIIDYYTSNQDRMDYKMYQKIGCGIIGSGAIESTHRTLIQKRMKLSGQRWSNKGAKNILKLRLANMNNQWGEIIKLIKYTAQKAA